MYAKVVKGDSVIRKELGKSSYTTVDMETYKPTDADATMTKAILINISKANNSTDITNEQLI